MSSKSNSLLFLSTLLLLSLLPFCRSSEIDDEKEFSYYEGTDNGPEQWGKMHQDWGSCNGGKMQSPIDLHNQRIEIMPGLGRLNRNYKPAQALLKNRGHDIMLKWEGDAGWININGIKYNLKQCHWHSPSEHTFNGSRYHLELHMVHESKDGEIAVVGITYKFGRPDTFLAKLISGINYVGTDDIDVGIINPRDVKIGSRKYFRYVGSLTVPPCTEGVIWTIFKKVRTVSREQVRLLREAVHDGYEANARPVQLHEDRTVLFYTPWLPK